MKVLVKQSRTDPEENKMCKNSMRILKFQVGKTHGLTNILLNTVFETVLTAMRSESLIVRN